MNYKFKKHLYEDAIDHSFAKKAAYAEKQQFNGAGPQDVFDYVDDFHNGFAIVRLDGRYNFINRLCNVLRNDLWYDKVWYFHDGLAKVQLGDKYNFINTDGNILRNDLWYDNAGNFHEGFAQVLLLNKGWNFIKPDGNFLRDDLWFDWVRDFSNGFAEVHVKNKGCNFIKPDGNLLRDDLWFDEAYIFHDGFVKVKLKRKSYYLDTQGNLYDKDKNPIDNVPSNKRRVVRMTESQLRNTIKNVVAQYLNESIRR